MEICDFERKFPQGFLCDLDNAAPEGVVYLITNLINDKVYVGQTWLGLSERWQQHLYDLDNGSYFHKAIRKYGPDSFVIGFLGNARTQEELDALEIAWIAILGSAYPKYGYNSTWGGKGGRHNQQTKEKIGEISKNLWLDPAYREKVTKAIGLAISSPKYKANHAAQAKLRWETDPVLRQKHSESLRSVWNDPIYQQNMSESTKRNWQNPDYVSKQQSAHLAAISLPEYRANLSSALSVALNKPEYKEKRRKIASEKWDDPVFVSKQKEGMNRPEVITKLSTTLTERWKDPISREKLLTGMREGRKRKKDQQKTEGILVS